MNVLIISGKVKYEPRHGVTKKGTKFVSAMIVSQNPRMQRDDYFTVVGFGKVAEGMQTLQVGQSIMATGEASVEVNDKDGKHYGNLKCYANNIELIGAEPAQPSKIDPADVPPKEFAERPPHVPKSKPPQQSQDDDVPF